MSLLVLRKLPSAVVQECEHVRALGTDSSTSRQVLLHVCIDLLSLTCCDLAGCLFPLMRYGRIHVEYTEWSWVHQMLMKGCSPSASLRHIKTI